MHFTQTVYRNPYWPTWPLLQITQGCTHNRCRFCTMYRDVPFRMQPMEWIEEDLEELKRTVPDADSIQLLSANPLAPVYDVLAPILERIDAALPRMAHIYASTRVTDIRNKTAAQLKSLRDMGLKEISLGVESGDDRTLERIDKGYRASDIIEQCAKLTEAGIDFWMTFLNGVAGREGSTDHAVRSAEIFSRCRPMVVGTGGLVLFPGTPLLEDAARGEFTPLSEREMLIELKTFTENLTCDCTFITHHTVSGTDLTGPGFLKRRDRIVAALEHEIRFGDLDAMAAARREKRSL